MTYYCGNYLDDCIVFQSESFFEDADDTDGTLLTQKSAISFLFFGFSGIYYIESKSILSREIQLFRPKNEPHLLAEKPLTDGKKEK